MRELIERNCLGYNDANDSYLTGYEFVKDYGIAEITSKNHKGNWAIHKRRTRYSEDGREYAVICGQQVFLDSYWYL